MPSPRTGPGLVRPGPGQARAWSGPGLVRPGPGQAPGQSGPMPPRPGFRSTLGAGDVSPHFFPGKFQSAITRQKCRVFDPVSFEKNVGASPPVLAVGPDWPDLDFFCQPKIRGRILILARWQRSAQCWGAPPGRTPPGGSPGPGRPPRSTLWGPWGPIGPMGGAPAPHGALGAP